MTVPAATAPGRARKETRQVLTAPLRGHQAPGCRLRSRKSCRKTLDSRAARGADATPRADHASARRAAASTILWSDIDGGHLLINTKHKRMWGVDAVDRPRPARLAEQPARPAARPRRASQPAGLGGQARRRGAAVARLPHRAAGTAQRARRTGGRAAVHRSTGAAARRPGRSDRAHHDRAAAGRRAAPRPLAAHLRRRPSPAPPRPCRSRRGDRRLRRHPRPNRATAARVIFRPHSPPRRGTPPARHKPSPGPPRCRATGRNLISRHRRHRQSSRSAISVQTVSKPNAEYLPMSHPSPPRSHLRVRAPETARVGRTYAEDPKPFGRSRRTRPVSLRNRR